MGILSTLGKIASVGAIAAAPFTGGATLWPKLLTAGLGAAGGILAARGGVGKYPSPTPEETALTKEQTALISQLRSTASGLVPLANQYYGMSTQAYDPALNYYLKLLSGDTAEVSSLLAPEIRRINASYDAALRSTGLNPRSGPGAEYMAQLPFERAGKIADLAGTARATAGPALAQMGQTAGYLGTNVFSNVIQGLSAATSAGRSQQDYLATERYRQMVAKLQEYETSKDIGRSIFDIISLLGKFGSGGGSTSAGGAGARPTLTGVTGAGSGSLPPLPW